MLAKLIFYSLLTQFNLHPPNIKSEAISINLGQPHYHIILQLLKYYSAFTVSSAPDSTTSEDTASTEAAFLERRVRVAFFAALALDIFSL